MRHSLSVRRCPDVCLHVRPGRFLSVSSFTFLPSVDESMPSVGKKKQRGDKRTSVLGRRSNIHFEVVKVCADTSPCVSTMTECLPPDCELQYPVRSLDEDERFLPAAVERRSVYVDELVADLQLLAQGGLPSILDLQTKTPIGRDERRRVGRQTESTLRLRTRQTSRTGGE